MTTTATAAKFIETHASSAFVASTKNLPADFSDFQEWKNTVTADNKPHCVCIECGTHVLPSSIATILFEWLSISRRLRPVYIAEQLSSSPFGVFFDHKVYIPEESNEDEQKHVWELLRWTGETVRALGPAWKASALSPAFSLVRDFLVANSVPAQRLDARLTWSSQIMLLVRLLRSPEAAAEFLTIVRATPVSVPPRQPVRPARLDLDVPLLSAYLDACAAQLPPAAPHSSRTFFGVLVQLARDLPNDASYAASLGKDSEPLAAARSRVMQLLLAVNRPRAEAAFSRLYAALDKPHPLDHTMDGEVGRVGDTLDSICQAVEAALSVTAIDVGAHE
jgi:hypothetical protein